MRWRSLSAHDKACPHCEQEMETQSQHESFLTLYCEDCDVFVFLNFDKSKEVSA